MVGIARKTVLSCGLFPRELQLHKLRRRSRRVRLDLLPERLVEVDVDEADANRAEVIKREHKPEGDKTRFLSPFFITSRLTLVGACDNHFASPAD